MWSFVVITLDNQTSKRSDTRTQGLPPNMVGLGEVVDAASRWVDEHKRGIAYGMISDVESLTG